MIINNKMKKIYEKQIEDLKRECREALNMGALVATENLKKSIETVKQNLASSPRVRISLESLSSIKTEGGRATFLYNHITIGLPKHLFDETKSCEKSRDKLLKSLAHELGHAVLHTEDLIKNPKDYTKNIAYNPLNVSKDPVKEMEADAFAEKLLNFIYEQKHISES
jgi:hypothetical protein